MDTNTYSGKEYRSIIEEVANIHTDTPMEALNEIMDKLAKEIHQIRPYAGFAFLTDDKPEMKFWKGQYIALERLRKFVEEKRLRLMDEEKQAAELFKSKQDGKMTFAEHVKEKMATLEDCDHALFQDIVLGLKKSGWIEEGGSPTYRLLHNYNSAIKIFRHADSPEVIKICFSAPPEESKTNEETESTS